MWTSCARMHTHAHLFNQLLPNLTTVSPTINKRYYHIFDLWSVQTQTESIGCSSTNTWVNTLISLISLFSFTYCCVHFSLSFSLIYFKCYIYLNIVVMLQHKSFYLFLYFTTRYQSIPYIYTFNSHPPTDVHIEHFRKPNKIEAYILKETLINFVFFYISVQRLLDSVVIQVVWLQSIIEYCKVLGGKRKENHKTNFLQFILYPSKINTTHQFFMHVYFTTIIIKTTKYVKLLQTSELSVLQWYTFHFHNISNILYNQRGFRNCIHDRSVKYCEYWRNQCQRFCIMALMSVNTYFTCCFFFMFHIVSRPVWYENQFNVKLIYFE